MTDATPLLPSIAIDERDGVRSYLDRQALDDATEREIAARERYEATLREPDGRLIFDDVVRKANFIQVFRDVQDRLGVAPGSRVLELGGEQGWASALVKRRCPEAHVVISDLAADGPRFARRYEQLLDVTIDERWAFDCRRMPFADGVFDRVFTFAAFHHFGRGGNYREAVAEIVRVLRPGGEAVLLYEPSSPGWLYRAAHRRVNRRVEKDGVYEDVLRMSHLREVAGAVGARVEVESYPQPRWRDGVNQTLYYGLLSRLPKPANWLVSTVNVRIVKGA